jgi:hypothetical protein
MKLLTSDMLTRGRTLISRGEHERAHHLLRETRSIHKGLDKGRLPPPILSQAPPPLPQPIENPLSPSAGVDLRTMSALDVRA